MDMLQGEVLSTPAIVDYILLEATDGKDLRASVVAMLAKGWSLWYGPFVNAAIGYGYNQAMVRYAEDEQASDRTAVRLFTGQDSSQVLEDVDALAQVQETYADFLAGTGRI